MPQIELVNIPFYEPLQPYIHLVDNMPISAIVTRVDLVNSQVDVDTQILADSIGTQGTLANRLAQSINEDGTLKVTAIDSALHHIGDHLDGDGFVRMTLDERSKLSFIASEATNMQVWVTTVSSIRQFVNETMVLQPSDSIVWRVAGSNVYADTNFPAAVRHTHYYGLVPVAQNQITPDYKSYYTTSMFTAYQEGSLRIFVNGVRLNSNGVVYVPIGMPGVVSYLSLSYTEGTATSGLVTGGDFVLSQAIPSTASIVIDFDVLY